MIDRLGVVLAGGRSTRFGSDKFLYPYEGTEMGLRAIRSLQPVVDRIVVAGRRDLPDSWHAHPVFGEREGSGPLGAILDASEHSPARRVVVVPCDMPNLTSAAIDKLIER